jgi:vacuolar protein sorting-associated protein 13A/C
LDLFAGKLILKIPWKNLYSSPVEAYVEKLYLLVVPNTAIRYDADKEEKLEISTKKGQIERFEQAKKLEEEKGCVLFVLSLIVVHLT